MSNQYLLDTNTVIYYINGVFDEKNSKIDDIFENSFNISIITRIEFLGWAGYREKNLFENAKEFIDNAHVFALDDEVAEATVNIRQNQRIKIPDAIIAATAHVYNLALVTGNEKDFKGIVKEIFNPLP